MIWRDYPRFILPELHNCGRCGETHAGLVFARFTRANDHYSHWCLCPTSGEPILMRVQHDGESEDMEYRQLAVLAKDYSEAMAAGDVPRAGRIINNLIGRLKNLDPATIRAAIEFFKAIIGEFGLNTAEALATPLSADQLLQPGIISDLTVIEAKWADYELDGNAEQTDAEVAEGATTEETQALADAEAENVPTAKLALGQYAQLFALLLQFIRMVRQQNA